MTDSLYPIYCSSTGHLIGEGTEGQLREYYQAVSAGEPFTDKGELRMPTNTAPKTQGVAAPAAAPVLTVVKG